MSRTIYVDADSCRRKIQEYLFRFVMRESNKDIVLVLVSDRFFSNLPDHTRITQIQVAQAEDSADEYIVEHAKKDDLVLTKDLSLAEKLLVQNISVINDLAEQYNKDSISARKRRAVFNAELRTFRRTEEATKIKNINQKKEEARQFQSFVQFLNEWKQEEMN